MTIDDLLTALVGALLGGGGLGTLVLARERRRAASEARREGAEIARVERHDAAADAAEIEFRAYLREQIARAEERHAAEIGQRDAQHAELMSALQLARDAHASAELRAIRAEERVAELEREVAELREWRRQVDAKTPAASRAVGVEEWRSRSGG